MESPVTLVTRLGARWVPYLTCPEFAEENVVCPGGFGDVGDVTRGGAPLEPDEKSCWLTVEKPLSLGFLRGTLVSRDLVREE